MASSAARNEQLDILRGFAIVFVIIQHLPFLYPFRVEFPYPFRQTWAGVDLFFVISGFVVTSSLAPALERGLPESGPRLKPFFAALKGFYLKRVTRLVPMSLVMIGVFLFGTAFFRTAGFSNFSQIGTEAFYILTYTYNFYSLRADAVLNLGWCWSLSIEEQFYIIFPWLLLLVRGNAKRVFFFFAYFFVILISRYLFVDHLSNPTVALRDQPWFRFDSIFVGAGIYFLGKTARWQKLVAPLASKRDLTRSVSLLLLLAVALVPDLTGAWPGQRLYITPLLGVISGLLVVGAVHCPGSLGFLNPGKATSWLGVRCYSLYLLHCVFFIYCKEFAERYGFFTRGTEADHRFLFLPYTIFYALLLLASVEVLFRAIENPITRWGQRLAGSGKPMDSSPTPWAPMGGSFAALAAAAAFLVYATANTASLKPWVHTAGVRKVERVLEIIRVNKRASASVATDPPATTFTLSEDEVNAYIGYTITKQPSREGITVRSASVRFLPGRVIAAQAVARVDISVLKFLPAGSMLTRLLSADNSIELQCFVSSANGKIFLQVRNAKVKGVSVPDSLVASVLGAVGKKQRPPLDFTRLFPLPNGMEKVEILPGALRLKVGIYPKERA